MLLKALTLAGVLLGVMAASAAAATIDVTTATDVVANDGVCSLREAVTAANAGMRSGSAPGECEAGAPGSNQIVLASGTYGLSDGQLDVSSPITLIGQGAAVSTINAEGVSRILNVGPGGDLTVRNLTLTGGHAPDGADAVSTTPATGGESGGAIDSAGSLTLENVTVTGNQAGNGGNGSPSFSSVPQTQGNGGGGGAIETTGPSLSIVDSTIANNAAGSGGNGGSSSLHFPVADNGGSGGGIEAGSMTITIVGSTLSGNRAGAAGDASGGNATSGEGAALVAGGTQVILTDDTIADNLGPQPVVEIGSSKPAVLNQVTIAGNSPGSCCGTDLSLSTNTIIRNSAIDGGCVVPVVDGGHNISLAGGHCPGTPIAASGFDLSPLQDNGGPTETMLPGTGSRLIDEVPSRGARCLATDQRGLPRPQGRACDAGAVEVRAPVVALHPRRLKLGLTRVGHKRRKTLRLTYVSGEDSLAIGKARITGRSSRDFRVVANRCRGKTLGHGGSCTLVVSFKATKRGKRRAKLTITIAGPAGPTTVWLAGTGFA